MKLFIISDIHGSYKYLKKAINKFNDSGADYLLILGDILYHGARNDLPEEYNTKKCLALLNEYSEKIIAVRGNCDSEVDQMVLNFNITADYNQLILGDKRLFMTHGHLYEDSLPTLNKGDIYIQGHSHVLKAENSNGIHILNPGSISLPKEGNQNTYGIIDNKKFKVIDFEGKVILDYEF
ncbi:phosphodiesterase [Mycoplasmatota bacterium WC44]